MKIGGLALHHLHQDVCEVELHRHSVSAETRIT
jgi:hypothetical protein